jgi:Kef-type K+ transport system membrane component KefB
MNKLIFQIGVLGFCIAAVVFGGSGGSIIEIVSRSFIVFVGIVLAATALVLVAGTMMEKNAMHDEARHTTEPTNAQQSNLKSP